MSEAPTYKQVRKDGRYVTIDTRTGQEVGPFEGQLKPVGDFFRSQLQKAKTTLQVGLSDLQNLPGDIAPHLIYSDTAVDDKGRPLTKAQAGEHNYNREKRIKEILKGSSAKPAATAQPPKGSRGLPADYKETEQQAGKTAEDFRPGAGFRGVPAPNGGEASGTRTGPAPMTMEDANKILNRGGLKGKGYEVQNPFTSIQLPTSSASLYKGDGSDISYNKELPENMFIQESDLKLSRNAFDAGSGVEYGQNLVQMPASGKIEYEQKAGSPLTVSSGTLKVTEANESAQQPEVNVDMARRRAFLDGDLNSMEALRAIEAQKGIVVTGNTYNVVNPNAGKEGENDFIKIDKAQRDTIMRGGEGAQSLLNSYVTGIKAEGQSLTSPAPENYISTKQSPIAPIDSTAQVDASQITDAPTLIDEVKPKFTDKDKTGRYNLFR